MTASDRARGSVLAGHFIQDRIMPARQAFALHVVWTDHGLGVRGVSDEEQIECDGCGLAIPGSDHVLMHYATLSNNDQGTSRSLFEYGYSCSKDCAGSDLARGLRQARYAAWMEGIECGLKLCEETPNS